MVVTTNCEVEKTDFESLLISSLKQLHKDATARPDYYLAREAQKLEHDVFEIMKICAKGGIFDNTIELHSGQKFPDIVAKKLFGVEVKTTIKDHYKTTGNSILETTRIEGVERIYLLFGKLVKPISFVVKPYEECMCEVVVTHSPRYLIDMETPPGETIFDKIALPYAKLRVSQNPIKHILDYYKKKAKETGEHVWWLDTGDDAEAAGSATVKLWAHVDTAEQNLLRIKAMALFPEIFSNNNKKYYRLATWLAGINGIVTPNVRDLFTAGGQSEIRVGRKLYCDVPKIFIHLHNNVRYIVDYICALKEEDLKYYWDIKTRLGTQKKRIDKWIELVVGNASKTLKDHGLDVETMLREQIRK